MTAVYVDCAMSDDTRRAALYAGDVIAHAPTPSSLAFVEFARGLLSEAFGSRDPEKAQYDIPVEEYAELLAELKPRFIHHGQSKECIQGILRETGCDLDKTYFDVPRMRSATSDDYLCSGIAYAFHPHRDCWYSAPFCQINWWIPIYAIRPDNVMAFHPRYWSEPVRNGSRDYNYEEWNRTSRHNAAQFIKADTRVQPRPEQPMELDPQIRVILPPGGILVFSGAQMHSTVPNTSGRTRFSIDFRTVHIDDVAGPRGARNVDSECTGTTMRDYLRATDLSHVPEELVGLYDTPARSQPVGSGA